MESNAPWAKGGTVFLFLLLGSDKLSRDREVSPVCFLFVGLPRGALARGSDKSKTYSYYVVCGSPRVATCMTTCRPALWNSQCLRITGRRVKEVFSLSLGTCWNHRLLLLPRKAVLQEFQPSTGACCLRVASGNINSWVAHASGLVPVVEYSWQRS